MVSVFFLVLLGFCAVRETLGNFRHLNEWVAHIPGGKARAEEVAKSFHFDLEGLVSNHEDHYILRHKDGLEGEQGNKTALLSQHPHVLWVEQQVARKRRRREAVSSSWEPSWNDPHYPLMWYLRRGINEGSYDMNVREAWGLGYSGKGSVVTILDDGIDYTHPDLKTNYDKDASYDINDKDNDPMPNDKNSGNKHGTRCAGEVAATGNNSNCAVGVAYNAKIGGVRMLDGDITDRVEAESISLNPNHIDIYSGSWGPDDDGMRYEGPGRMASNAFLRGVTQGRKGLGNIFVWASGNGGLHGDSCAGDGYASSPYTLSISSVSEMGLKPWYLEECASTIISTYSSGGPKEKQISTTDLYHKCTDRHTGTSASAPIAAAIVALVLEANRNLTWRDVQYICILTANPRPFVDGEFITNGVGRKVSLRYGYGLMDAGKMVRLAEIWHNLPPRHTCSTGWIAVDSPLKNYFSISVPISSQGCYDDDTSHVSHLEHVQLYLDLSYSSRGQLSIVLKSPAGTRSVLLPPRERDNSNGRADMDKWPLLSVAFWGELSRGDWILEVSNRESGGRSDLVATYSGVLSRVKLDLHGTSEMQPVRLKSPPRETPMDWFRQFQAFVVDTHSTSSQTPPTPVSIHTHGSPSKNFSRGRTDTSNENFHKNRHMIKCHSECFNSTACYNEGPFHCESCKNYQLPNGECVPRCGPGHFTNPEVPSQCLPCHVTCLTCKGPRSTQCLTCDAGLVASPADNVTGIMGDTVICQRKCPPSFYLNKERNQCLPCTAGCVSCVAASQCSMCETKLQLENGLCVSRCGRGHFFNSSKICALCASHCDLCSGPSDVSCQRCPTPLLLLLPQTVGGNHAMPRDDTHGWPKEGRCVTRCPNDSFYQDGHHCFRCSVGCVRCMNQSQCLACDNTFTLKGGTCYPPFGKICTSDSCVRSQHMLYYLTLIGLPISLLIFAISLCLYLQCRSSTHSPKRDYSSHIPLLGAEEFLDNEDSADDVMNLYVKPSSKVTSINHDKDNDEELSSGLGSTPSPDKSPDRLVDLTSFL